MLKSNSVKFWKDSWQISGFVVFTYLGAIYIYTVFDILVFRTVVDKQKS